mgnify:CR=1 FL=1
MKYLRESIIVVAASVLGISSSVAEGPPSWSSPVDRAPPSYPPTLTSSPI